MRTCKTCGETKPTDQYGKTTRRKDGLTTACRPCIAEGARDIRKQPEDIARRRARSLMRLYGITVEQYDAMFAAQNGLCLICGGPETVLEVRTGEVRWLAVDHDHQTGHVRGLLCCRCNQAIGYFRDDPKLMRLGAAYIEERQAAA